MIVLEGTDVVRKTSTIEGLKKYHDYLKNTDCLILINHDEEEMLRSVYSRDIISDYDLDTNKYNELYKEMYKYMKENNMLEKKLFLVDVTSLTLNEQIEKVRKVISCQG